MAPTAASRPQNPATQRPTPTATIETSDSKMSSSVVSPNSRWARRMATRKLSYRLISARPATATRPQVHSAASGSPARSGARSQAHATRPRA